MAIVPAVGPRRVARRAVDDRRKSRACAGVANGKFIFCLPGSGGAVRDGWNKIIVHQLDARTRPCNLVEIMPRLMER